MENPAGAEDICPCGAGRFGGDADEDVPEAADDKRRELELGPACLIGVACAGAVADGPAAGLDAGAPNRAKRFSRI